MQATQAELKVRTHAQQNMGEFAWPTVILGLVVTGGYIATPLMVATGLLPLWPGALLMILLTYAAYTVLHEAVHGTIAGSHRSLRWVNELMGYLAAWVMMIPMTAHRHEHLAHHRNTNKPDADPDYLVAGMMRSPLHPFIAIFRILRSQFCYFIKNRWGKGPRSQDLYFCLEVAAALIPRILFMALAGWTVGAVLFFVGVIGGLLVTMYLFAYLVHHPHKAVGRYVDTSTFTVPGMLGGLVNLLWGFQNYHSIHHLFPRVPFYRYPRVFDAIEHTMSESGAPIYRLDVSGMHRVRGHNPETSPVPVSS